MPATKIARFIFKSRGDKFRYKRESASLNVDKVFDTLEEAKKFKTEIEPKFAKAKEDAFKKRGEKIQESKCCHSYNRK